MLVHLFVMFVDLFVVMELVITYICGTSPAKIVTAWHARPTRLLIGFPRTLITALTFKLPTCNELKIDLLETPRLFHCLEVL